MNFPAMLTRFGWSIDADVERRTFRFACRDEVTQLDYVFEVPMHLVAGLHQAIGKVAAQRPELFSRTSTREIP